MKTNNTPTTETSQEPTPITLSVSECETVADIGLTIRAQQTAMQVFLNHLIRDRKAQTNGWSYRLSDDQQQLVPVKLA